jgi:hypothetical protein
MGKKRKIIYLRDRIMIDIEKINLLLDFIASNRIETINEASILASIALDKGKQISKNNEKIGKFLNY